MGLSLLKIVSICSLLLPAWSVVSRGDPLSSFLEEHDWEPLSELGYGEFHQKLMQGINERTLTFNDAKMNLVFEDLPLSAQLHCIKATMVVKNTYGKPYFKENVVTMEDLKKEADSAKVGQLHLDQLLLDVDKLDPCLSYVLKGAVIFGSLSPMIQGEILAKKRLLQERQRNRDKHTPERLSSEATSLLLREFYEAIRDSLAVAQPEMVFLHLHTSSPLGDMLSSVERKGYSISPVYWIKRAVFECLQAHIDSIGEQVQRLIKMKDGAVVGYKKFRATPLEELVELQGGERGWLERKLAEMSILYERIMLPRGGILPPNLAGVQQFQDPYVRIYLSELFQSPFFLGLKPRKIGALCSAVVAELDSIPRDRIKQEMLNSIYLSDDDTEALKDLPAKLLNVDLSPILPVEGKAGVALGGREPQLYEDLLGNSRLKLLFGAYRKYLEQVAVNWLVKEVNFESDPLSDWYDLSETGYFYRFFYAYSLEPKNDHETIERLIRRTFLLNLKDSPSAVAGHLKRYHFSVSRILYRRARLFSHWMHKTWNPQFLEVWLKQAVQDNLHIPSPLPNWDEKDPVTPFK